MSKERTNISIDKELKEKSKKILKAGKTDLSKFVEDCLLALTEDESGEKINNLIHAIYSVKKK